MSIDYSVWLERIVELLESIVPMMEQLEQLLVNVNGYFYILIFALAGVGLLYLFYRFLRIFL